MEFNERQNIDMLLIGFLYELSIFYKGPTPVSFSFIFGLFKQTIQFLQEIIVKNVHPVYSAGIWTHDLSNMSRHP